MEDIDYSLLPEKLLNKYFPDLDKPKGETIIFMQRCKKYSRFSLANDRILVLSTKNLYLFDPQKHHTTCPIESLEFIIVSSMSKEFVLKFKDKDFRLNLIDREDFIAYLKMRFANLSPQKGLKYYSVPEKTLQ